MKVILFFVSAILAGCVWLTGHAAFQKMSGEAVAFMWWATLTIVGVGTVVLLLRLLLVVTRGPKAQDPTEQEMRAFLLAMQSLDRHNQPVQPMLPPSGMVH